jgi:transcription antitermination factor NusG
MDLREFENRWFALQVRSRTENVCSLILGNKGYETFLPTSIFGDEARNRPKPLFPGYLFCKLRHFAYGPILTTPGVIRVVGFGTMPAPISDEEIGSLRSMISSGCPVAPCPYTIGKRIRIIGGPLKGIPGTVIRVKNAFRLVVSVDLLQRSAAVEVDARWIAPDASAPRAERRTTPTRPNQACD